MTRSQGRWILRIGLVCWGKIHPGFAGSDPGQGEQYSLQVVRERQKIQVRKMALLQKHNGLGRNSLIYGGIKYYNWI